MQIAQILKKAAAELRLAGSSTPELDAQILLSYTLLKEKSYLLSHPEMPLTNAQYARIKRLINRRKKGEPIAYITRHKEFFGLDLYVNKKVLIPRPESEWLVEKALGSIPKTENRKQPKNRLLFTDYCILDVGTGSGCLIIAIAKKLEERSAGLYAADVSQAALRVARKNALEYGVLQEIKFFNSDLFANKRLPKKYDLIIANLPYVPRENTSPYSPPKLGGARGGIDYEPKIAIYAGDNGSEIIKRFILESKDRLNIGGTILLELDPRNALEIKNFAKKIFPDAEVELSKDLAKWERYLKISKRS